MTLLALQDLFRHHREKASGLWKLGVEPNRTLFFDAGDIVFAQSTHPTDRLTYLLVERGKLTQAQLDYALANLKPGLSIGKNLIEMGFITQRDLLDVARAQVERVVQGALGTPGQQPVFEPKELDATVVRLPLDTPQLLLNGMLNLQDRERLMELLGPLNQVVVLQGRRLMDMNLPPDLAKLPPLLDGTHTLLELSREAFAEPLRMGTFALFLREIGWARLHEMPPLDRQALDRALNAEVEPLAPPLPEPAKSPGPSLFSTIQDAARPTTNLEHLSHALDAIPTEDPDFPSPPALDGDQAGGEPWLPEPAGPALDLSGFTVESGHALLPTPSMELPEPLMIEEEEAPASAPEPPLALKPSTRLPVTAEAEIESPSAEAAPVLAMDSAGRRNRWLPLAALLAVGALGVGAWWWWANRAVPEPNPAEPQVSVSPKPADPVPQPPAPADTVGQTVPGGEVPPVAPPKADPPKPEPPAAEPPKAEPPKVQNAGVGTSPRERAEALVRGDLDLALKQGKAFARASTQGQWTLRLEIACMGETLRKAVEFFPQGKADLFVLPIVLKDGRTCYQVFHGQFASQKAAEQAKADLPKAFHEGGNRPKVFRFSELPERQ